MRPTSILFLAFSLLYLCMPSTNSISHAKFPGFLAYKDHSRFQGCQPHPIQIYPKMISKTIGNSHSKYGNGGCGKADPCFPEVSSPAGCILSCDDERFDDCPNSFIQIFNPQFCGWTRDQEWRNFTFACQACTTEGVLGILEGQCSCDNIKCLEGQECFEGRCIAEAECEDDGDCSEGFFCSGGQCVDRCIVTLCPVNTICKAGMCIPNGC